MTDDAAEPMALTDAEWRERLSPEQFAVLRQHMTERPGTSVLNQEARPGRYACAGCGTDLFEATTKFDAGCGWPSFWAPLEGAVASQIDRTHGMVRIEVHCAKCGGHLGHVFPDGPRPTNERYCINGVSLAFKPQ